MRRVSNDYCLFEAPPAEHEEIPKVLHYYDDRTGGRMNRRVWQSWNSAHRDRWDLRVWNKARLAAWIVDNKADFAATFFDYPSDEHRWMAARWLLLSEIGGVFVAPRTICLRPLDELTAWKRLILCGQRDSYGSLVAGDQLAASSANHPFWSGIIHALELARHKPVGDAVGAAFLTDRARTAVNFLKRSDWPSLIDPRAFATKPDGSDWLRLVDAGMLAPLAMMLPDVWAVPLPDSPAILS